MSATKAAAMFVVPACVGALSFFAVLSITYAGGDIDTSADAKCNPFISQCSCGKVLVNGKCQLKGEKENMNGCSCESDVKPAGGICIAKNNCLGTWYTNQKGDKVPVEVPPDSAGQRPGTAGSVTPVSPSLPPALLPAGGGTPIADPSIFQYMPTPNIPGSEGSDPWKGVGTEPTPYSELERLVRDAQANAPVVGPESTAKPKSFLEQTLEYWRIPFSEPGQTSPWTPVDANGNAVGESANTNASAQTTGFGADTSDAGTGSTSWCDGSWYCPMVEAGHKAWDALAKEFGGDVQARPTGDQPLIPGKNQASLCNSAAGCGRWQSDVGRTFYTKELSHFNDRVCATGPCDNATPGLAHRSWPIGATVEVCSGGSCVDAKVMDRGPAESLTDRTIDANPALRTALNMRGGLAEATYTLKSVPDYALPSGPTLASVDPPSDVPEVFEPPPANYLPPLVTAGDSIATQWSERTSAIDWNAVATGWEGLTADSARQDRDLQAEFAVNQIDWAEAVVVTNEAPEISTEPEKPSASEVGEAPVPAQERGVALPSACSGPSAADCVEALGKNWNTERNVLAKQVGCTAGTARCNAQILESIRNTAAPAPAAPPRNDNPYAAAANYKGGSIVNFLKAANAPNDFTSRTNLAARYLGIPAASYIGSEPQNTALLQALRKTIR